MQGERNPLIFISNISKMNKWNLAKLICTTETDCHYNFPENAQQNLVKIFSQSGHTVFMCIFIGNSLPVLSATFVKQI